MTPSTPFWRSIEAIHDVVYFSPDAKAQFEAVGLKGFWMGYVASRSAAMGTPSPELIVATFHGFAPRMITRAIPDAWAMASREDILTARLEVARESLAPGLEGLDVETLAKSVQGIARGLDFAGKPLAAAHASLPVPDDAIGAFWHGATIIREYRGDAHVAVLTAAGLDGVAANVLAQAVGIVGSNQRDMRGWTEDEWAGGIERLRQRGWMDADGTATDAGRAARQQIEDATDRVSAVGISEEAKAYSVTAEAGIVEAARAVADSGAVSFPNPTGAGKP